MKVPQSPPSHHDLFKAEDRDGLTAAITDSSPVDHKKRYLHWDEMRRRTPPNGLTLNQWWLGTTIARQATRKVLPIRDASGSAFHYSNVDRIQELLHQIDRQASGQLLADDVVTNLQSSDRYLVSSLVEEAISSSQLEGASTTRRVAKQLLMTGREPRDRSERMIVNNYRAMLLAETLGLGEDLEIDDICTLHSTVTDGTLDDPNDAGRIQTADEERIAVHWTDDTLLHKPPPAEMLDSRLKALCAFASEERDGEQFIHPVIRSIAIHFWLAYDHPFVDGNGRTSRALFYWSMLHRGYWLFEYVSIS